MRKKKKRPASVTIFLWICLICYLILLFKVILFKFDIDTILNIIHDRDELPYTRVNLVPFQTIRFYLLSGRVPFAVSARNLLGNILAFMPIGLLIPLLRQDLSLGFTFLFGLAISVGIEITQYYTGLGSADIDDVILNVIGTMSISLFLCFLDAIVFLLKKIKKTIQKALDKRHHRV